MTLASFKELKQSNSMGQTIKLGFGLLVGLAADVAVTALLKQHIPVGKGIVRILCKLGIFAIGMKVGEDVENYFCQFYDDTKADWNEAKKEAEKIALEHLNDIKDEGGH